MPFLPEDERHLRHALELATAAVGLASPNPTVGCVLVSASGEIVGEGAHYYDALDHAEIVALKQAGDRDRNATAYVTLEPCTTHGRTGPCAEALIAARIRRCVIATADPNPAVHGKGIARLREAGIAVEVADGPLAQQARELNDAFACSITRGRPFVTLKAALSTDGKLAPTLRTSTTPHWLTGEAARADVQTLRHSADAILTGIGTLLADNPALTDRTGLPRRRKLLRVILDSHLRTPVSSQLVQHADDDVLLLCSEHASQAKSLALEDYGVEILRLPGAQHPLSLNAVLAELDRRKILHVLAESGSALNASLLRANLVDKLVLYYAETELGSTAVPFANNGPSPFMLQEKLLRPTRTTFPHDNSEDIRITGYLNDPWP